MFAIFFLAIGALFSWFIYQAISTRDILAKGWGWNTRTYNRDDQPVSFWVTFFSHLICAAVAFFMAFAIILKRL